MVMRLLRVSGDLASDAADALACAICHAHVAASVAALSVAAPELAAGVVRVRRGRLAVRG